MIDAMSLILKGQADLSVIEAGLKINLDGSGYREKIQTKAFIRII